MYYVMFIVLLLLSRILTEKLINASPKRNTWVELMVRSYAIWSVISCNDLVWELFLHPAGV